MPFLFCAGGITHNASALDFAVLHSTYKSHLNHINIHIRILYLTELKKIDCRVIRLPLRFLILQFNDWLSMCRNSNGVL